MNCSVLVAMSNAFSFSDGHYSTFDYNYLKRFNGYGLNVRAIVPYTEPFNLLPSSQCKTLGSFSVNLGGKTVEGLLRFTQYEGVYTYLIDSPAYFENVQLGWDNETERENEAERFIYFAWAVLKALPLIEDFKPGIIHCLDWPTAFIPFLLNSKRAVLDIPQDIKTIMTYSDISRQGVFSNDNVNFLNMNWQEYCSYGLNYYEQLNFLKSGLLFADLITTFSPGYSNETTEEMYAETLEDVTSACKDKMLGILNGIDLDENNPLTDKNLLFNYSFENTEKRLLNKEPVQESLGLQVDKEIPLLFFNSELRAERGADIIQFALPFILKCPVQLVIMYKEDSKHEGEEESFNEFFRTEAGLYSKNFCLLPHNNELCRQMYAAADIYLAPSASEPCGTDPMIAMRYGCVPVARKTGSLADIVIPYEENTGIGTGFTFKYLNDKVFLFALRQAMECYSNKDHWNILVKNCMAQNFGIDRSVNEYCRVYQSLS